MIKKEPVRLVVVGKLFEMVGKLIGKDICVTLAGKDFSIPREKEPTGRAFFGANTLSANRI